VGFHSDDHKDQAESSAGLRIQAGEVEQLVATAYVNGFSIPAASIRQSRHGFQNHLLSKGWSCGLREIGRQWSELPPSRRRVVFTTLIERVEVRLDQIDIHLRPTGLSALLHDRSERKP
jgi:hypothetical protein